MEFYISWCFVAFICYTISLISSLIDKYSQVSKNFEKIGFYYKLSSSKYELNRATKWKEFLIIIWHTFLNVIFSRISVILFIYIWIKKLVERLKTPDKMKEITFKLKHQNLTKEEMLSLWNEGNEYLWYDEWSYYYKEDEIAEIVDGVAMVYDLDLGNGLWLNSVHISPFINRIFLMEWGFWTIFSRVFEYRISWTKLLVKCMQYDIKSWASNVEYAIKNGKMDETVLKARYNSNDYEETEEEYIEWFKKLCDWHVFKNIRITSFVFATEQDGKRGGRKMAKEEFNSLIDSKISDLQKCCKEIEDLSKKYKSLQDIKDGDNLTKTQQKEQKEYREILNKIYEKYWCSDMEIGNKKEKIIDELNSYKL